MICAKKNETELIWKVFFFVSVYSSSFNLFILLYLQHYGPEMPYAAFAGKDASRAFITGVEKEIEGKKSSEDHVLSLSPAELVSLDKWKAFYDENYDLVGRLIGR